MRAPDFGGFNLIKGKGKPYDLDSISDLWTGELLVWHLTTIIQRSSMQEALVKVESLLLETFKAYAQKALP